MGDYTLTLIVIVVVMALVFDFINGFHDTANAIATVVSTGVLRPRTAVLMAAVLNVGGAFLGTRVASTIGKDIIDPTSVTQAIVLAALIGAILWNLLTWWGGIPSSSSHALIGGLCGAGAAGLGFGEIKTEGVEKVVTALIVSPLLGFFAAFFGMVATYWALRRSRPARVNIVARRLQLFSSGFMALSHGTNDAQKSMGVITMALLAYRGDHDPTGKFPVPAWVIVACALAMGAGTATGGWRIIKTMGTRIFRLRPIHGCIAETSAALVIQAASYMALPVSTTHCITASIMGAGATTRLSAVSWGVTRRILTAWVLTIPMTALAAALVYTLFQRMGLR
jgi:inorganic phosphate transporter, PiT family